jgi:hypothetical protein
MAPDPINQTVPKAVRDKTLIHLKEIDFVGEMFKS